MSRAPISSLKEEIVKSDPTELTTDQLHREILSLKTLLETRMDAGAEAIKLLQSRADRSPTIDVLVERILALDRLIASNFTSNATALAAAFKASGEAVSEQNKSNLAAASKAEASFTKQIDQVGTLIEALDKKTDGKIDDLKIRVTAIEGHSKGKDDSRAYIVAIIGILVGVGGLAIAILKVVPL